MKMKTITIIVTMILINIVYFSFNSVNAFGIGDVIRGGDTFVEQSDDDTISFDQSEMKKVSDSIYNILLLIGIATAVIIAGILGIKFMLGSMEEQAKVKEALIPFVIGCIVVFGAFAIWKIFVEIGKSTL